MKRRWSSTQGQAATETLLSMLFLMLFIFGAVQMAMFAVSKYIANYGAFYGARTAMVTGGGASLVSRGGLAARQAMLNWQLETLVWVTSKNKTYRGVSRQVFHTMSEVPFGAPIFKMLTPFVFVYGNAPLTVDNVDDKGDNQ